MEMLLGYEEYFVQRKDLTLWYYKIAVSRVYGRCQVILPSDHIARRAGGLTPTYTIRLDVIRQIPLDQYEADLRKSLWVESLATGQTDPNYILVDLAILIATRPPPVAAVVGGVALLHSLFTFQSGGGASVIFEGLLGELWKLALLKVVNIKNDWIVELSTEGINQALPLLNGTSKSAGPSSRQLEKVLAFRHRARPDQFIRWSKQMDAQLKKHMQQKAMEYKK